MKIPRNATEVAVGNELSRIRETGPVAAAPCWCSACQADVRALSLSSLPPNYYTTFDFDTVLARAGSAKIQKTVAGAVERVARYPKHGRFNGREGLPDLRVINFSLEEGCTVIEEMTSAPGASCSCPSCRNDALAYALNRYPAKYGVERGGHIEFPKSERDTIRRELSSIINQAIRVVASKPRHS